MRRTVKLISPNSAVNYNSFLELQSSILRSKLVSNGEGKDFVLLMEHDGPVFTGGRRLKGFLEGSHDLKAAGATVFETSRGGLLTWHGPGQLCMYPILDLKRYRPSMHWYVERLEGILIRVCREFDVEARGGDDRCSEVGVWTGERRKLGFIGIQNNQWITSFGLSLNVSNDLKWFDMIEPCGFTDITVTSLEKECGTKVPIDTVKAEMTEAFSETFNVDLY